MVWLPCPYLGTEVELTAERERHIAAKQPNVRPWDVAAALADPEVTIGRPWKPWQTLFVREVDDASGEFHIVVAVVRDEPTSDVQPPRHWVFTACKALALPPAL